MEAAASGTGGTMTCYDDFGILSQGMSYSPHDNIGTTNYYVSETLLGCEGPEDPVAITINNCDIIIPTAFTPNNDLINDDWEIVNLDVIYPDNEVHVYNR